MIAFLKYLILTRKFVSLVGLVVIAVFVGTAISAPLLYSWNDVTLVNLSNSMLSPSIHHLLGTDEFGRSMLGRVIWGARISLIVAVISVGIALVFGVLIGGLAGYYEGPIAFVTMRTMDALISFPRILLAIMLIAILGPGIVSLTLAIGISTTPIFARLSRAPVLSLKDQDFVVASRSLGAGDMRLLLRHILPNTLSLMIVQASISLAQAILMASGLSFLGLGPQPPVPEWGAMIASAREYMVSEPHVVYAPGVALFLVILAFNVVGDALRDYLDPKTKRQSG